MDDAQPKTPAHPERRRVRRRLNPIDPATGERRFVDRRKTPGLSALFDALGDELVSEEGGPLPESAKKKT